jgi:class 3 adenylate cyclase
MKTLRWKLFISVGSVFLVVAFLNYLIPEIWVRKELNKASQYLNQYIEKVQTNLHQFASFLVIYNLVEGAAELDGIAKIIPQQAKKSDHEASLELAWQIAAFNSQIAFVQLSSASELIVITSEDANLYAPLWAPFDRGMLWIKIPEREELFVAIPFEADASMASYMLFDEKTMENPLPMNLDPSLREKLAFAAGQLGKGHSASFNALPQTSYSLSPQDSPAAIFQGLTEQENEWLEKMNLLQQLIAVREKKLSVPVAGLFQDGVSFERGACLLTDEIFQNTPIVTDSETKDSDLPFLLLREGRAGKDLDMARTFVLNGGKWIGLGFSLSLPIKKIAQMIQKPVLLRWGKNVLGFDETGKEFDPRPLNGKVETSGTDSSLDFPARDLDQPKLTWKGATYYLNRIPLKEIDLFILTPEAEATALDRFLTALKSGISQKISLSLVGAALFSLGVALLLLEAISKRITQPIALLSHAAEELGRGKYEGLVLPELGNREDEVAVLTRSFKNMLIALQERDKIRGVLNKVVSKEISEEILKSRIELGGEERTITIFFSDIRGFTHLSETLPPKAVIGLLNEYMTRMCQIIDETHGVVDKFIGDAIMALYGAPLKLEQHAVKAIEAALKMMQHLRKWNEERQKAKEPILEVGIGIHTGLVCAGNMGADNRLNYTVIGANVNLASRLCGTALPLQILVSEETWKIPEVQARFRFKALPPVALKGIDQPVHVYEVIQE